MAHNNHDIKRSDDDLNRHTSHISYDRTDGGALSKTVTIDAELFERLYLGPKTQVSGDLRSTFANPTPVALLGFSVGLLPITAAYMGWRGAGAGGANAAATTAATIWFGGMLLIIAGVMEWVLGNAFPFIVFMGYGAHFLTLGITFIPYYGAVSSFNPDGSQALSPAFAAGFGFYPLAMTLLSLAFLLGSLRTNLMFFLIFVFATTGFGTATAGFWYIANGDATYGTNLLIATGAAFFAADMLGWYLFFSAIIATMELPMPDLPIFDLSQVIKARPRGVASKKEEKPTVANP